MPHLDIDFAGELNADQYAAVVCPPDRPALVLAGAGSGKTRTLTYRVAWLISEYGLSPREILLLTFTNKAAAQMLSRISELTGFAPHEFWGGTFHSVGNRFLRIEHEAAGLQPNFTILDSEDSEKLLRHVVEEHFGGFLSNKENPRPKLIREIISYARNTRQGIAGAMVERFSWLETPARTILDISEAYTQVRRNGNYCDFDDLLELWLSTLQNNPDVLKKYRDRFKNILVDEYQDTNLLQSEILDLLADRGQISAVGDDAQCIYSWRGAEIDNILEFRERYPSAHIRKIERNYRSTPQILAFANAVLGQMPSDDDYKKVLVAAREGTQKPIVIPLLDGQSQARKVCRLISDINEGGKFCYDDIAVLYRSHFQAMDLQLQLQNLGIPFVMTSGIKFFEQAHIKDIVAQLKFAANPKDFVSFLRIVRFLPKVGDKTVRKIFDKIFAETQKTGKSPFETMGDKNVVAKVPSGARKLWEEMAADIKYLGELSARAESEAEKSAKSRGENADSSKPVSGAASAKQSDFFSIMEKSEPKLAAAETSENSGDAKKNVLGESVTEADCDAKALVKAACGAWYAGAMKTVYEDWQDRADDFDALFDYAGRYPALEDFLANVSLETDAEANSDESSQGGRVRLMTVHQAKGLEFPVVFVIGAAEGLFPSKRSLDDGDTDEELRLFYVAVTRAKDLLVITYPRVSVSNGNYETREESRFLEGVEPSLYQRLD